MDPQSVKVVRDTSPTVVYLLQFDTGENTNVMPVQLLQGLNGQLLLPQVHQNRVSKQLPFENCEVEPNYVKNNNDSVQTKKTDNQIIFKKISQNLTKSEVTPYLNISKQYYLKQLITDDGKDANVLIDNAQIQNTEHNNPSISNILATPKDVKYGKSALTMNLKPLNLSNKEHCNNQKELANNLCLPQNYKEIDVQTPPQCDVKDSKLERSNEKLSKQRNDTIHKITKSNTIKNYVHISDVKTPPRAIAVMPNVLQIKGRIITPRKTLITRVRFGPVQGVQKIISKAEANTLVTTMGPPIFLLNLDNDRVIQIDVTDLDKSNWIGLLPLGNETTANLWLYEEENELYVMASAAIRPRQPLRLGYSAAYARDHQIPEGAPTKDLNSVPVQWWCSECNKSLSSASLLQRHIEGCKKGTIKKSHHGHRCRYCRRTFSRSYALKRHIAINCLKKPKPPREPAITEPDTSAISNEESRLPSDESFHTFTHSIDFSTSLFDTDRIPSLDMTSQSIADTDLTSYPLEFRDENVLNNDLSFTKMTCDQSQSYIEENETIVTSEVPSYTCPYCNQVLVTMNKIKHLRKCPFRLTCGCGRVFRYKETLTRHIEKSHPNGEPDHNDATIKEGKKPPDGNAIFQCDKCVMRFKRRGILVNHLWRIHKTVLTTPVERKVRHYPCVACSKVYRSATKRNIHIKRHHPNAVKLRGLSIEGGVRQCAAAACAHCPRQYTTRAKLYQHVRAAHPRLSDTE